MKTATAIKMGTRRRDFFISCEDGEGFNSCVGVGMV